jgi:putative DNA primase/helicase
MNTMQADKPLMLKSAEYWTGKGFEVFPLKPFLKIPATGDGFKSATTDIDTLKQWFASGANYNLGLKTGGGVVVIDIDTKDGDGMAELAGVEMRLGALPETLTITTPSGGQHLYFRYAKELDIRSSAKQLAPNVDVRANGGYVVVPPSRTDTNADPKGRTATGDYTIAKKLPIAELPSAWLDALLHKRDHKPPTNQPPRHAEPSHDQRLSEIKDALAYIDAAPHDQWVRVGMALYSLGNDGLALWDAWSSKAANYDAAEIPKRWKSFAGCAVNIETVFFIATQSGWKNPAKGRKPEQPQQREQHDRAGHKHRQGERMADAPPNAKQPEPLPPDLPPVQKLSYTWLPTVLGEYVQDASEQMNSPPDFLAVTLLVAVATVIGRKVGVRPQENTDWTEICNLWAVLVGRPGVMKSPTMGVGLRPLNKLIAKANRNNADAGKEWEARQAVGKMRVEAAKASYKKALAKDKSALIDPSEFMADDEESPPAKRYLTSDATEEALLTVLQDNPNGLMVFRDEIVGLLKGMDRDDRAGQRAMFLTGWNGNTPHTSDRIGRGLNLNVEAVCLSVLGATQPGKISAYVRQAVKGGEGDDGLLQRFSLAVWPDIGEYVEVDRQPDKGKSVAVNYLFEFLDTLKPEDVGATQDVDAEGQPDGVPYLRFDAEALAIFRDWRVDLENRLRSDELHPALESHLAKYRKTVPSLALILHLADRQVGSIGAIPLLQAIKLAGYFESHAVRLYASVAMPEVSAAKTILRKLKAGEIPQPFKARDIYRKGWAGLDRETVEEALTMLVDYSWLDEYSEDTTGRSVMLYALTAAAHSGA